MAITYDLTTSAGEVRLYIGDTVDTEGPRPDGRNFTDVEIAFFLTENGGDVDKATISALMTLAAEWRAFALTERAKNLEFDAKATAEGYVAQANAFRKHPPSKPEGRFMLKVV